MPCPTIVFIITKKNHFDPLNNHFMYNPPGSCVGSLESLGDTVVMNKDVWAGRLTGVGRVGGEVRGGVRQALVAVLALTHTCGTVVWKQQLVRIGFSKKYLVDYWIRLRS